MGKHLARVDGKIGDTQAKKYWYVTDHLGSIRAVTDKDGKKVWSADYLAFGKQCIKDGDFEELHSFTGKEYDPDTGLYYYNARWYDSELGRFVSEDPVADPNNPNLYSYCRNNPLRFIDPTGLYYEGYVSQSEAMSMHQSRSSSSGGNYGGTSGGNQGSTSSSDGSGSSGREAAPGSTKSKDFWGRETETTWDKDGNKLSETRFDKDGNLKGTKYYNPDGTLHSEYSYNKDGMVSSYSAYNPVGMRTVTTYEYNDRGIIVTRKNQQKGKFGWKTGNYEVYGYNNYEDLSDNNWNFRIDNTGRLTIGDNVENVNGDMLLKGFVSYLSNKNISCVGWLFGLSISRWDVTNIAGIRDLSFIVDGIEYNANDFGNIEVGYIGEYYASLGITEFGSVIIHLQRHGLNNLDDEFGHDHSLMDFGARYYNQTHQTVVW